MSAYEIMSLAQLKQAKAELTKEYQDFKSKNLSLDMSRGKPSRDQLKSCIDMLDCVNKYTGSYTSGGVDTRNYGVLEGIPEARQLFADILDVRPEQILVGGNSSLNLMYDAVSRAYSHGVLGSVRPWCKEEKIKFLCPAPGYDRHFAISEFFGFELVTIDMTADGPDMDQVEHYVNNDSAVKAIWCVPKYANPEGITYSDETVKRFSKLKPAAPDFRIFWDNAYCMHDIYNEPDELLNIFEECEKRGTQNMVLEFTSTSKITFPGSGIACIAASEENIDHIKKQMFYQTIGFDKINMLRHVKYFRCLGGIKAHMEHMADMLRPRFDAVLDNFETELAPLNIAKWNKPKGGYFISFYAKEGCAKRIVELCSQGGVKMTPAGASYPYGKDSLDSNIRIAPSFPSVEELELASKLFCICVKLATVERVIENHSAMDKKAI